jgi:hypothetical protein
MLGMEDRPRVGHHRALKTPGSGLSWWAGCKAPSGLDSGPRDLFRLHQSLTTKTFFA